jgi:hypothetical protein
VRRSRFQTSDTTPRSLVGELRPSQMLYTYGVGAIVDLPRIAAMVMGIDDWDVNLGTVLPEARLLAAVQQVLGETVQELRTPPFRDESVVPGTVDDGPLLGVPVATFPRWLVCPKCRLLSRISSGLFEFKPGPMFRPERSSYVHINCQRVPNPPDALPVRFLTACPKGHLDDFPWMEFVHGGATSCQGPLHLFDQGIAGEAADLYVRCSGCTVPSKPMSQAFGPEAARNFPSKCRGRRPHLRDFEEGGCEETVKCILLGASNSWFPLTLSTLFLPEEEDRLAQLVEQHWGLLATITSKEVLTAFKVVPQTATQLAAFSTYPDDDLLSAIQSRREGVNARPVYDARDIKTPEWLVFSDPSRAQRTEDLELTPVAAPIGYDDLIEKVVLVERVREVKALVGFTRIDPPGEMLDIDDVPVDQRAPLSRRDPTWVPATEVRGEGIFIQFKRDSILDWMSGASIRERGRQMLAAHRDWRSARGLEPDHGFPEIGFALIHSISHALMRQFVLECGYTAASIRERIYWTRATSERVPMAGLLIYTAAPDSEGTLGGLVSLGQPDVLGDHLDQALEMVRLCSSDPLCAEHIPSHSHGAMHAAACHACLFAPETSCEASNMYLDRTVLVPTVTRDDLAFFRREGDR